MRMLLLYTGSVTVLAAPASAHDAQSLPFWAEPYPAGYVRRETVCLKRDAIKTREGTTYRLVDVCRPAIRVMD